MLPSEVATSCKQLQEQFPALRDRAAARFPSEDVPLDEFFLMAMFGFSLTCSLFWTPADDEIVESLRFEPDPLQGQKWVSFWGLAIGYWLGRLRSGAIAEHEFEYAMAVVPGYMYGHFPDFCGP